MNKGQLVLAGCGGAVSRNHGTPESRRESGQSDCPAMEEKYCGDTITAKWTYVMNQNTISGNGRRWDVGIIFRRNRQNDYCNLNKASESISAINLLVLKITPSYVR